MPIKPSVFNGLRDLKVNKVSCRFIHFNAKMVRKWCGKNRERVPTQTLRFVTIDFIAEAIYNKNRGQMMETNLAQTVDATNDSGAAYDTNVKYLLADKQILSRILKYTVEEFRDMDIPDIMGCIGDDIEIGTRPVDAGLSNLGRVQGTVTEDNVPGEGTIYYDIRFTAYHKEREIKILINIEAQKSSDSGKLGYHLENRIIFYLARMISAQKHTEFFHSDFDSLKKVRSIWICMDNDETEDSIEEIRLDRKTVFGNKQNPYHTDLMKGIIVNIRNGSGKSVKKSQNMLIAMLEELVSEKDAVEKKRILADEYGMVMTAELERRIQVMCNWSESVRERIEEQIREQERMNVRIDVIEKMIKANATKEQIISYGFTEAEYAEAESSVYANS